MISVNYFMAMGKGESISVTPIGDIHWGASGCAKEKLMACVDWIANDPNAYWVGMGDMIEAINISDKRWDERQIDPAYRHIYSNLTSEQRQDVAKVLRPIAKKCFGIVEGNHERTVRKHYHTDHHTMLCEDLKCVNLGESGFVTLSFQRNKSAERHSFVIFVHHGKGGGETPGAIANNLARLASKFEFDVGLLGHAHRKMSMDIDYLYPPNSFSGSRIPKDKVDNKLVFGFGDHNWKKRILAGTGGLFNAYPSSDPIDPRKKKGSYAADALMSPTSSGFVRINITPFKYVGSNRCKLDYHISL